MTQFGEMYFSNKTPFETFSSDVRNVSNPYILDGCNMGKSVTRGSSVQTAGQLAGQLAGLTARTAQTAEPATAGFNRGT